MKVRNSLKSLRGRHRNLRQLLGGDDFRLDQQLSEQRPAGFTAGALRRRARIEDHEAMVAGGGQVGPTIR